MFRQSGRTRFRGGFVRDPRTYMKADRPEQGDLRGDTGAMRRVVSTIWIAT